MGGGGEKKILVGQKKSKKIRETKNSKKNIRARTKKIHTPHGDRKKIRARRKWQILELSPQ